MSRHGLEALILIAIDRRAGEWVTVEQIASRLGAARDRVLAVCADLAAQAQVQHARFDGHEAYGIHIGGVDP